MWNHLMKHNSARFHTKWQSIVPGYLKKIQKNQCTAMHPNKSWWPSLSTSLNTQESLCDGLNTHQLLICCRLDPAGRPNNQMTERKWNWYKVVKLKYTKNLDSYQRHIARYGSPGTWWHLATIHMQLLKTTEWGLSYAWQMCPIKFDKLIDYDNDYGYTDVR